MPSALPPRCPPNSKILVPPMTLACSHTAAVIVIAIVISDGSLFAIIVGSVVGGVVFAGVIIGIIIWLSSVGGSAGSGTAATAGALAAGPAPVVAAKRPPHTRFSPSQTHQAFGYHNYGYHDNERHHPANYHSRIYVHSD